MTAAEAEVPGSDGGGSGPGRVVSVNVGTPRVVDWFGRRVTTAIWKEPVAGRVPVAGVNVVGDDQADRRVHGGPAMAVYAYAVEDYEWWSGELGVRLAPGTFGENLTLEGVDLHAGIDRAVFAIDELLEWAARDERAGEVDAGVPDDEGD